MRDYEKLNDDDKGVVDGAFLQVISEMLIQGCVYSNDDRAERLVDAIVQFMVDSEPVRFEYRFGEGIDCCVQLFKVGDYVRVNGCRGRVESVSATVGGWRYGVDLGFYHLPYFMQGELVASHESD